MYEANTLAQCPHKHRKLLKNIFHHISIFLFYGTHINKLLQTALYCVLQIQSMDIAAFNKV